MLEDKKNSGSRHLLLPCYQLSPATNYRHQKIKHSYFSNGHIFLKAFWCVFVPFTLEIVILYV